MNWVHSCKRVSELLSQSLDEPLGWFDRIRLRVHLSMCGNCRNIEQQLDGVRALSMVLFSSDAELEDAQVRAPGASPDAQASSSTRQD